MEQPRAQRLGVRTMALKLLDGGHRKSMCICIETASDGHVGRIMSTFFWTVITRWPCELSSTSQSASSSVPSVGGSSQGRYSHDRARLASGSVELRDSSCQGGPIGDGELPVGGREMELDGLG